MPMRHLFFIPFIFTLLLPLLQASAAPQPPPPAAATSPGLLWSWDDSGNGDMWQGAVVAGDALYAGSFGGRVQALDRRTGAPLWAADLAPPPTPDDPYSAADIRPLGVAAGRLFVTVDGAPAALDAATGNIVWRRPDVPIDWEAPALEAAGALLASDWGSWGGCGPGADATTRALEMATGATRGPAPGAVCLA
ncbi:MAG TPA: PQQ-binding-like beta-propeller repeat protein, partial [Herpetosiphonaceae bacterium]